MRKKPKENLQKEDYKYAKISQEINVEMFNVKKLILEKYSKQIPKPNQVIAHIQINVLNKNNVNIYITYLMEMIQIGKKEFQQLYLIIKACHLNGLTVI